MTAENLDSSRLPVIEMRDVTVNSHRNPGVVLTEHVNWTVQAGEFWVVAGAQRSGKSDLLMLAGGLTAPAQGSYNFLGQPMPIFEEERLTHRLKLGFVFDTGQLFNQMTVAENIALPLRYHHNLSPADAESRVLEVMTLMELTGLAHQMPGALARNWQKRAGLARALILKPELLLVDTPLSGLDIRHATWWLNFLEQLSAGHDFLGNRPATIVVTTDDPARLATGLRRPCHFAVMNQAKFHIVGDREALSANRDSWVTELLSAEAPATIN